MSWYYYYYYYHHHYVLQVLEFVYMIWKSDDCLWSWKLWRFVWVAVRMRQVHLQVQSLHQIVALFHCCPHLPLCMVFLRQVLGHHQWLSSRTHLRAMNSRCILICHLCWKVSTACLSCCFVINLRYVSIQFYQSRWHTAEAVFFRQYWLWTKIIVERFWKALTKLWTCTAVGWMICSQLLHTWRLETSWHDVTVITTWSSVRRIDE